MSPSSNKPLSTKHANNSSSESCPSASQEFCFNPNSDMPLDPTCNFSESCQPTSEELCFNPNSNIPLATELVNSSFSKSYQQVMQIAQDFQQAPEAFASAITQIQSDMGDIEDLETVDKSSLVSAINEVNSHTDKNPSDIGALNDLDTDNKTSIVSAINEVNSHTDNNTSSISRIDSEIGSLNNLETDNKTSIVNAINEVNSHLGNTTDIAQLRTDMGSLSSLDTDNKTSLVNAINEVNSHADNNSSDMGALNDLDTDNKTSIVNAINEVNAHADTNTASITSVKTDMGSLSNLSTDNKSSIVGAINEVNTHADNNASSISDINSKIGALSSLETEDKTSVVNAINEVNTHADNNASAISALQTADTQNVKLTGAQTVAGVKTFSDAPVIPSLTTSTQIESSEGVGFDENGKLIPIKITTPIQLPPSADYIGTDSAGDAVKKTADTTVTSESSALVTSGAVFNSVKGVSDKVGDLTSLDTTDKSNLVSAVNEVNSALATKSDVGHKHSASDITSGVLPVANGGTGATTAKGAQKSLLSDMQTETTAMDDSTEFVMKYGTPTDTKGVLFKRSATLVWNYIKDKISSVLGLTKDNYGGKASTATTADSAKSMYSQTLDLSALDATKFYPAFCLSRSNFAEVAIFSIKTDDYASQNRIHFDISTNGWSEVPNSINIREYGCHNNNKILIGCIGRGLQSGGWALWLRGGCTYACFTRNCELSLKTSDYTYGTETYTVGTNYYGGSNTNVAVVFTPQSTITDGSYSNRPITAPSIKATTNFIGNLTGNATSAVSVVDYGDTSKTIKIGYTGAGATVDNLSHIAGYLTGGTQIKAVSKDTLTAWLGLDSYLPLSGGTMTGKLDVKAAGIRIPIGQPSSLEDGDIWIQ